MSDAIHLQRIAAALLAMAALVGCSDAGGLPGRATAITIGVVTAPAAAARPIATGLVGALRY